MFYYIHVEKFRFGSGNLNKVTKMRYYIESLCVFNFDEDDIFSALYELLCDDEEHTVALQSNFFRELSAAKSHVCQEKFQINLKVFRDFSEKISCITRKE